MKLLAESGQEQILLVEGHSQLFFCSLHFPFYFFFFSLNDLDISKYKAWGKGIVLTSSLK